MKKIKVILDNGHGSNTAGKHSPDYSIREYAYTREIVKRISKKLTSIGIDNVILVPEDTDIPLRERCNRANKLGNSSNSILLSIHLNAAGHGNWMNAGGWCAYTTRGKTKADDIATILYNKAEEKLTKYSANMEKLKAKGVYSNKQKPFRKDYSDGDPDQESDFYILYHSVMPAVLTENLFQDNREDVRLLLTEEYKQLITDIHVEAVQEYINKLNK